MPKISETISELMKQTEERIKAFEERAEGAPLENEEKKAIKDNLKRVLALKKLQKEEGDDAEIREEDIKTKIQDEVFFSTISKEFQLEDYKFAVENMDTIFETSEKINENHPEFVEFKKIVNSSMFFQKDSPDSLGEATKPIEYSYTRTAVHSIAAMKVLLDHKEDIEADRWTMEDFFSPDSLEERQKAFDAVWEKMQQNNEESDQWIAEQIYGGMQLGAKLSQDAVNKIDWNLSSSELLKKEEFIQLAAMQYFLFDVTQEQAYCEKEFIELIKNDHKDIDAKEACNDEMFMIKNGLHTPCGLLYDSYNNSVKSLCTCYYNQMNVNQSFMKVDPSLRDPQSKNMAESYVEDRLSEPLENALESMEVIDRISDRIKAHNKSLKNLIDDFDHFLVGRNIRSILSILINRSILSDRHAHEAPELTDTMVDMHDIVTDFKLTNLLQRQCHLTTSCLVRAQRIFMEAVEDLMVGEHTKLQVVVDETSVKRAVYKV